MKRFLLIFCLLIVGCTSKPESHDWPTFTLAYSEYPSWSVFGVAQEKGLITGDKNKPGTLEQKWKVIVDLKGVDYDTCMSMYGSNACDATCLTNMDALNPALGRPSTAILPTSTSFGADALVAVGVETPEQLKTVKVYGLEKSVSEYVFVRCLQKLNQDPNNYKFVNMDPGAAAQAVQTKQKNVQAIMVWNPFVLQTLRTRQGSRRLFDSSLIPGEVVDMVVVGNDSLSKKGGDAFAGCLVDAYYEVNSMLANTETADATYAALGAKFSNLNVDDMKLCCKETKFYGTPKEGVAVFTSQNFKDVNQRVVEFCLNRDIVKSEPTLGYGTDRTKNLTFDPSYMTTVGSLK